MCASSRTASKFPASTAGSTQCVTPASRARSRTAAASPANSGASRWQCVSIHDGIAPDDARTGPLSYVQPGSNRATVRARFFMRRPALYSSSRQPGSQQTQQAPEAAQPGAAAPATTPRRRFDPSSPRVLWVALLMMAAALAYSLSLGLRHTRAITQEDIDKAVLKTMETQTLPSEYAKAYDNVRPAVVRVVSYIKK